MINKGFVKGYALALFSLAADKNQFLIYKQDAKDIIKVIKENKKFIDFLSSGNINADKKAVIIKKVFIKIDKNITNLILILINKKRIKWLEKILLNLIVYINKKISIKEGIVYSVMNLSPIEIKRTEDFVSKKIQQKVELKNLIDKSLISGIKIMVDNHIIEDNVLSRLEQMKIKLLGKG